MAGSPFKAFSNFICLLGWTPLHEATNHGHYHLAQLLIKHGANVNATGLDDVTPLHDAASFGNQKLVKMLIDKGADPLFKNKKGKTAQDIAHPSLIHFFRSIAGELKIQRAKLFLVQWKLSRSASTLRELVAKFFLALFMPQVVDTREHFAHRIVQRFNLAFCLFISVSDASCSALSFLSPEREELSCGIDVSCEPAHYRRAMLVSIE